MTPHSLVFVNLPSRRQFSPCADAPGRGGGHSLEMANSKDDDAPDWYLQDWMAHFGKKQVDLIKELDYDKALAHYTFHSKRDYKRDRVNQLSAWLGIEPYELLMPPEKALAVRQLYSVAQQMVRNQEGTVITAGAERFLPPATVAIPKAGRKAS